MLWIFLCQLQLLWNSARSASCDSPYSCSLKSIYESGGSADIHVGGYFGAAQAVSLTINTTETGSVGCLASFACYKADSIQFINDSASSDAACIQCYGLYVKCTFKQTVRLFYEKYQSKNANEKNT